MTDPLYNRLVAWNARYNTDSDHCLEYAKAISALWEVLSQTKDRSGYLVRRWADIFTGLSNRAKL